MSNTQADRVDEADDDLALVCAAQAGDLQAFESLVLRHQKRMLNIAYRITGDRDDAIEVVQDVFLSAFRHLGDFRRESKFSTWLSSISVNLSRNRLKRMSVHRSRVPFSLDAPLETGDGAILPDPPSREPSALDRLERRDTAQTVRDCIMQLESGFREVIILRDMQELAYEEIGEILKLAAGTVKSRLFRAREAVKECLRRALGGL